jgi:FlaA1/EpsC-like NDP-sugar epimerase/lipopolysaccharide/colanic/teichoic acid biosynthesis glycosyltransferase
MERPSIPACSAESPAQRAAAENPFAKRLFDILAALAGIILLSPFLIAIALIIRLDGGPVFFSQVRVGHGGRPFRILKFRSMKADAGTDGPLVTASNDPRITRFGRFIRDTKINELPQLFNVLAGHMSLVGPRPEVPKYVAMWTDEDRERILSVKPGITEYASLVYIDEEKILGDVEDVEEVYVRRIMPHKLSLYRAYLEDRLCWLDIRLIAATVIKMGGKDYAWLLPELDFRSDYLRPIYELKACLDQRPAGDSGADLSCGGAASAGGGSFRKRPPKRRKEWGGVNKKLVAADFLLIAASYYLAFFIRLGSMTPAEVDFYFNSVAMVILLKAYFIYEFDLYKTDLRFTGINEIINLFKALLFSAPAMLLCIWASGAIGKLPRTVLFLDFLLSFLLLGSVRAFPRLYHSGLRYPLRAYIRHAVQAKSSFVSTQPSRWKRVLLYGAGRDAELLLRELCFSPASAFEPVGLIDESAERVGKSIHGFKILGQPEEIPDIARVKGVSEIIVCTEALRGRRLQQFIAFCSRHGISVRKVPPIVEIVDEKVRVSSIRRINVEDLIGREPVETERQSISQYLQGRRVLVTGAGGSIGSELCRRIMRFDPAELVLFGRGEHSIHAVSAELRRLYPDRAIPRVIGDVINAPKLERVFGAFRPQVVFHAGADKHVPLMEENPDEAVLNGIVGTRNLIAACDRSEVERLICISTDKAVNPTSVMGACKRVAEMLIQTRANGATRAIAVRFGNVLGSRGSFVPIFEEQIKRGGPVFVTHREMLRYFMTIPEAAHLAVQAGAIGADGDIFVLDMGEPLRIDDLARTMIQLAGLKPDEDIEVRYQGLRPGEKLYEELTSADETPEPTAHPRIRKIRTACSWDPVWLAEKIENLRVLAVEMDSEGIRRALSEILPGFRHAEPHPASEILRPAEP